MHVLVRSLSHGCTEIRDSTGQRSDSEVLAFAIDELRAAHDLFP